MIGIYTPCRGVTRPSVDRSLVIFPTAQNYVWCDTELHVVCLLDPKTQKNSSVFIHHPSFPTKKISFIIRPRPPPPALPSLSRCCQTPVRMHHPKTTTNQVAERLMATVSVSKEAVPTFVGHAGSAIRKLRRLCVGCEVELSPVTGEFAEVSLLAEDEAKLGAAIGLVERWIRQQQVGLSVLRLLPFSLMRPSVRQIFAAHAH